MTNKHLTDQQFIDLPLVDTLQTGLREAGFEFCTPIQAQSLPVALKGNDVAGQAQTGTGKTIAFLLACCNLLLTKEPLKGYEPGQPRSLILAPTRELAIQIHKDALLLNKHTGLSIGLVYGGTGYEEQKTMLSGKNDILIGTPGRLIDFFKQKLFTLKYIQVAVMDEADRMFDLGFIKDIRYLLRKMPAANERLNLLFSATLSFRVMELAYEHLNDPEEIKISADVVVADKVTEYSYYPAISEKLPLLINMLRKQNPDRVLVFVNTRHAAEEVSLTLDFNDIGSAMLSGDVPQKKREKLLEKFKSGQCKVLVATDVAARGLHIPSVSHVYNFDLPQDAEDYVHRIGRTARAGESGEAISFICEKYAYSIMEIEEFIGHGLPRKEIEADMLTEIKSAPRRGRRDKFSQQKDRRNKARPDRKSESKRGSSKFQSNANKNITPPQDSSATTNNFPTSNPDSQRSNLLARQSSNPDEAKKNQSPVASNKAPPPAKPTLISPAIAAEAPDHPPRFSRRFGEVPAIG